MQIPAKYLAAASFAVAKNDQRYMLQGVCVKRRPFSDGDQTSAIQIVATNGHILVRVNTDLPYDIGTQTPPDELIFEFTPDQTRELRKAANRETNVVLNVGASSPNTQTGIDVTSATMELNQTVSPLKIIDGKFPDTEKVWPEATGERNPDTGLSATYLGIVEKVEKAINGNGRAPGVKLIHNESGPVLIEFGADKSVGMLIMPMRL